MKKYVENLMPHYGLRKLSIGVASVLLGMSAAVITGHADSTVNNSKNTSVAANVNGDNINNSYQEKSQSSAINSDSNTESTSEVATNARQLSASGSENNSVSNSVNVQGASSVINSYSDNKISVRDSNHAENVNLEGYNWTNGGAGYDDPSKLNNGNSIPWAWTIYWTLRGSFDLTEQQLKSKNQIDLGTISESLSPVKSYSYYPRVNFGDNQLRLKDGSSVGYYYMNGDQLMVGLFGNYQGIGSQHFHFDQVNCETGYMASTACFRGKGAMDTTLTWQIGDHKYSTKIAKPGMPALIGSGHRDLNQLDNYGRSAAGNDLQICWSIGNTMTPEQFEAWDKSNGKSIGTPLKDSNVGLTYIFKLGGNDTLSPSSIHVEKRGETMDSQGHLHEDSGSHFANSYGGGVDDPLSDNYRVTNVDDGLTIDELKQLKANNPSGLIAYFSRQSDGTALVYIKVPASDLKIKNFDALRNELNSSPVINLDPDPQKAIDNTIDYYQNHNPLGGYPSSTNFVLWYGRADNTKVTHTEITYYDPVTEQPINKTPLKGIWGTSVNTVNGQSSVKLHVINATTGAAITQVKSFTDWPNQGKHADLVVPTVANYRLITDVNAANAVLAKYHLSGHILTGNASVDYPAENTISDYYLVMTPTVETVTVNIEDDDDQKILNSYTVTVKEDNTKIGLDSVDAQVKQLLDSGKYTLESSKLDQIKFNGVKVVAVKLKHKVDSIQRRYRVIEDRPDGSNKVIIDMTVVLYKDANGSHWYWNGAMKDDVWNGVLLKPSVYTDLIGTRHDATDGSWVFGSYDRFIGYHPVLDSDQIWHDDGVRVYFEGDRFVTLDLFNGQVGVTDMKPSCDFHVSYVKNQYPVIISYYDLSGKLVSTSSKNYEYLDTVDVQGQAPEGYILLAGQAATIKVGADTNEVDLLVTPKMKIERETRQSKRIINVENRDDSVTTVVQRIIWQRDVTENMVSGERITGEWHSVGADTMAAWSAAVIDGYVTPRVDALKATPETGEVTVLLKYISKVDSNKPHYLDVTGKGYSELPTGYHVVSGQSDDYGLLIVKDTNPVVPINKIEYVTRTITVEMPNGRVRTIRQRAVKGHYFMQAHLPKLRGYKIVITGSVDKMAADDNMTAVVKFVKM